MLLGSVLLPTFDPLISADNFIGQIAKVRQEHPDSIVVSSFNIRIDREERNPDNHFSLRVHRMANFLARSQLDFVGTQEAYGGQMEHLLREVNMRQSTVFRAVESDVGDAMYKARTAIIYNADRFELIERAHQWLSETPSVPSASWGSKGIRTATTGVFRRIGTNATVSFARFLCS